MSGDCAASTQSCNSGNAANSQLISTPVKINRNKYFHKCVADSSKLHTSQTAGTKQSSPAIVQIVKNSTWPEEEQIRNGCPSGQRYQLTIADKSLLAITLSYQIHLEFEDEDATPYTS